VFRNDATASCCATESVQADWVFKDRRDFVMLVGINAVLIVVAVVWEW
jgi:hypothetical protein